MADGQHAGIAGNDLPCFGLQTGKLSILGAQACDLGIEANFTAQGNDPLADILHHGQQHICAHMGLGIIENILPGTGLHKLLQNPADSGVVDTGVQLAIGEGSGTALAKLDIASDIKNAGFKEFLYLFMAGFRILAPFQNQGLPSGNGQHQRRKHTGRAKAHNYRTLFRLRNVFRCLIVRHRRNGCPFAAALL